MTTIFRPFQLGAVSLRNRFVMSPMTRGRATVDAKYTFLANELTAEYYAARARGECGLIVTEGVHISDKARGWVNVPGIWTDDQEAAWKRVAAKVHETPGAAISMQLWHQGRVTHSSFGNGQPWGPSPVAASEQARTPAGSQPCEVPHEMTHADIAKTVEEFATAARRALRAGFDQVQIHAANGYLVQQFLSDRSNHRKDRYGGSAANRTTFLLEILAAMRKELGDLTRVSVRLSPTTLYNDCRDSSPLDTFSTVAQLLQEHASDLAYLEVVEDRTSLTEAQYVAPNLRQIWKGVFAFNTDMDAVKGQQMIDAGQTDLIVIGRPFIANPDLVKRYKAGAALAQPDYSRLFYVDPNIAKGYTDYPAAL